MIHVFTPFVSLCNLKYNDCNAEDTEFIGRKKKGFKVLDEDQEKARVYWRRQVFAVVMVPVVMAVILGLIYGLGEVFNVFSKVGHRDQQPNIDSCFHSVCFVM